MNTNPQSPYEQVKAALDDLIAYVQQQAAENNLCWGLLAKNQVLVKALTAQKILPGLIQSHASEGLDEVLLDRIQTALDNVTDYDTSTGEYAKAALEAMRPYLRTPEHPQEGSQNSDLLAPQSRENENAHPDRADAVNLTLSTADELLRVLREDGWSVAVHNDYRLNGDPFTFWLFAKGNQCVKGEGRTDKEALKQVFYALPPTRSDDGLVEVAPGWRLYSADFSCEGRKGSVTLTRDEAGSKWWRDLSESEKDETHLFVTGFGETIQEALIDANAKTSKRRGRHDRRSGFRPHRGAVFQARSLVDLRR